MKIVSMPLGMIGANCYLIFTDQHHAAVIDPGGDADRIIARIQKAGAELSFIMLTHGHHDHIAGLWDLLEKYPVPVYIEEGDLEMLTDIQLSLCNMAPLYFHYQPGADLRPLQDGDQLTLDELTFTVIHTPGHSKGSSCYQLNHILFSGDTLFAGSVGRTDLYGGSFTSLRNSLRKLDSLPDECSIYPGHGLSSTLGRERKFNPYLE